MRQYVRTLLDTEKDIGRAFTGLLISGFGVRVPGGSPEKAYIDAENERPGHCDRGVLLGLKVRGWVIGEPVPTLAPVGTVHTRR